MVHNGQERGSADLVAIVEGFGWRASGLVIVLPGQLLAFQVPQIGLKLFQQYGILFGRIFQLLQGGHAIFKPLDYPGRAFTHHGVACVGWDGASACAGNREDAMAAAMRKLAFFILGSPSSTSKSMTWHWHIHNIRVCRKPCPTGHSVLYVRYEF